MMTRVQCCECGVWIPMEESRLANDVDEMLSVVMYPHDWRACKDPHACFRRKKDGVAAGASPSIGEVAFPVSGC